MGSEPPTVNAAEYRRLVVGVEAAGYRVDISGPNTQGMYLVTTITKTGGIGPSGVGASPVEAMLQLRAAL
jgi:hypothetical protein